MRKIIAITLLVISLEGFSQITLGSNATLSLGANTTFYAGPNTTFNGVVTNNGTIISYSDLDFVNNINAGSLRFIGVFDQNLSGDSLNVVDVEVNKQGDLILLTNQVIVTGSLDVAMGVIQAEDELDLLVQGSSDIDGDGFVEGKLVGLTSAGDVTFPMGVNGNPNYLTLSNTSSGTVVRVECDAPNLDILIGEEDVEEIAKEVEWIVNTLEGGSTEARLTVDFSGVDLTSDYAINATTREPAILVLAPGDSLFRIVSTSSVSNLDIASNITPPTSGRVVTSDFISIGEEPVRLVVAWVPVIDGIEFFVPNTFAPSGTLQENRIFRPFFSGEIVTSVAMRVFNSLNAEVYSISQSGTDIDLSLIGWDGRLQSGQDAPGGVYYYTITLNSASGEQKKVGTVLLLE